MFQEGFGDWRKYKDLKPQEVVDFRHADRGRYADRGPRERPYDDDMAEVQEKALKALQEAQEEGMRTVLFTHGRSTSRPGEITARSQVRGLMRSKEATPYIIKKDCIQHESVFVAFIRPKKH